MCRTIAIIITFEHPNKQELIFLNPLGMPNVKQLQIIEELKQHDHPDKMLTALVDVFEVWISSPIIDNLSAAERAEAFFLMRQYAAFIQEFGKPKVKPS